MRGWLTPLRRPRPGSPDRHVAIVVENLPVAVDTRLRKQVDALLDAGYKVSIIGKRAAENRMYDDTPRLTLLEYPDPGEAGSVLGYAREYLLSLVWASVLLARLHRRSPVDVLQVCQPPDIYFPLCRLMRRSGTSILVDQRDLMPELLQERYDQPPESLLRLLRWLERQTQAAADHAVTVNDYLRDRLIAAGASPERVSVVQNGPVMARVDTAARDAALAGDLRYLVCWEGKMGKQDGVERVLQVARHIVFDLDRRDCGFALLGDGECLDELRSQVLELGLGPWVKLPGWLPEHRVFDYLASADLGLDTSLQVEVTPVKVLEYMAHGLPFVSFDLQETRRVAAGAGVFVTPDDPVAVAREVVNLLGQPEARARLGAVGRARVRSYLSWECQRVTYLSVVRQLESAGGRRAGRGLSSREDSRTPPSRAGSAWATTNPTTRDS